VFRRTGGPSAKRGGSYGLAPPLAYARGGQSGSDGKCLSRVSAGTGVAKAVPGNGVLSYPGTFRQAGAGTASPPRLHMLAGGSPGQTASVCLAFQLEGAGRPCRQRFSSYPGTFRQAGGCVRPRPPACIRSRGAVRVRRQVFVSRFSLSIAPNCAAGERKVAGDGFCRTRGPSAKRGLVRPRPPACICSRGQSGSDGKCLSRVSAGRSGKAVPATVFVAPGDLPPSGGSYGLAPRLHMLAGGQSGSDGKCLSRVY
jgi:hypothetical protein